MKRLLLILLISIYTTATFGIGVRSFYCCSKLTSTSIAFTNGTAKKCGMDKTMKGCCKTTFQFLKVKDKHVGADNITAPAIPAIELYWITPSIHATTSIAVANSRVYNQANAPPLHNGIPLYLFDCIYRI